MADPTPTMTYQQELDLLRGLLVTGVRSYQMGDVSVTRDTAWMAQRVAWLETMLGNPYAAGGGRNYVSFGRRT